MGEDGGEGEVVAGAAAWLCAGAPAGWDADDVLAVGGLSGGVGRGEARGAPVRVWRCAGWGLWGWESCAVRGWVVGWVLT